MGNRGSKSDLYIRKSVKEQRVDGSWLLNKVQITFPNRSLRYTLMGFERNYQVRIPAKQTINRCYSIISNQQLINPWFITGFSDAEGSFIISIYKDAKSNLKWRVTANFSIHLHIKDIELLKLIQQTLGVGKVRKNSKTSAIFRVDNLQELQVVINHFKKYPLISAKHSDFVLFEQCYKLIKQKEHLNFQGLEKILGLKYNLNKGLPDEIKIAFPKIVPIDRPAYTYPEIPDPHWVSGFVSGDSSFCVSIEKSNNKLGERVRLIFSTKLHSRDTVLLVSMSNYFSNLNFQLPLELAESNTKPKDKQIIGNKQISLNSVNFNQGVSVHSSLINNSSQLQIKNSLDVENKVIPFFLKYPVLGVKRLDFEDFHKVFLLLKNKEHLNAEGLSKIKKIVNGMNLDRKIEV